MWKLEGDSNQDLQHVRSLSMWSYAELTESVEQNRNCCRLLHCKMVELSPLRDEELAEEAAAVLFNVILYTVLIINLMRKNATVSPELAKIG